METGQNAVWTLIKTGYALPFRVFSFFAGHYIRNRNRLKAFMARPGVANLFKGAIVVTMLVWIGVGFFASDAYRTRLTDVVKGLWADTQDLSADKQQPSASKTPGAPQ